MECACACLNNSLPQYLSDDLECYQKRALKIIYPHSSYVQALEETGLKSLYERREEISSKLFRDAGNTKHKLNKLLPKKFACPYNLRKKRTFDNPTTSTSRTQLNFINFNARNSYTL